MAQQEQAPSPRTRGDLYWPIAICQSLAVTCEVFLHRHFGRRYIGIRGVYGALLILFFPLLWPKEDATPLMLFFMAYLVAGFAARTGIMRRGVLPGNPHSRYTGIPRLLSLFPGASETFLKRFVEPFFVLTTGFLLLSYNLPLGSYLMLAGFGLLASVTATQASERKRLEDMNDAVIEQRNLGERFRRSHGNGR